MEGRQGRKALNYLLKSKIIKQRGEFRALQFPPETALCLLISGGGWHIQALPYSYPSHKAKPTVKKIQKSFKLPLTNQPKGCIMSVIVQDVCNSSCTKRIEVLHVH